MRIISRGSVYLCAFACLAEAQVPAIPEPPIILYGQVSPSTPAPDLSTVTFTLTGNSETVTTASPAQVVTVSGQSYFIVKVPFETRSIQGGPSLTATPTTLALTAANTAYTLTAKAGTATATLTTGKTTLIYGAPSQGLIDRIDLTLGETYEQWSQRLFGSLVSQTADADGDGRSNYDEYLAGTNPLDPSSRLMVKSFTPIRGGGFTITWDTVSGKSYRIERSTSLAPNQWTSLQSDVPGDGTLKSFTDTNPGTAARLFYRIGVGSDTP